MTTQKPETRANWKSALSALATGLCLLALVACGGSESQGAQESRQDRLLAAMPKRLSGEPPIEVMPISGEVWLQTYESAYQFGLRVNVRKWLEKLDRDADDIAVAWSRSRLIWVVGYSVDDVPADRLIPTFLASAFPRAKPRISRETIAGKRVTVARHFAGDPDYLVVSDGFLFHLPIIQERIARELIGQL